MILILYQPSRNSNAILVRKACEDLEVPFIFLNVDEYMNSQSYSWLFKNDDSVIMSNNAPTIKPTAIFNTVFDYVGRDSINQAAEDYKTFVANEMFGALYGPLLALPSVKWMNTPHSAFLSTLKLYQLRVAMDSGFFIPKTLISSESQCLKDFWTQQNGKVITKAIYRGSLTSKKFQKNKEYKLLFTNRVKNTHLDKLETENLVPILFQEEIEKKKELRIIVIGNTVFACTVGDNLNDIDWRTSQNATSNSVVVELDTKISNACIKLVRGLGLVLGVLDVIESMDNRYYFLEVNQQGGWKWMETQLHLPISKTIVQYLLN